MQVMNNSEFDQKDVLVGQSGKTEGFGVTNDPVLMSMLSTGLYGNPLRTMLQEIIFNAWDAHRMGNCQDKPIDVYLNDTTGLIVRDYGPGINPQDMRQIYCIYGNSTKRNDDGQTGGFGLGSKSPYAYNDSFTVTSHYDKQKYMYLMVRVSEENQGGPGMTPIIQGIPTGETGLMVTVGMKSDRDFKQAEHHIRNISFLSGIKMNFHYNVNGDNRDPELLESSTLKPGEWINTDFNNDDSYFYAVYGGVRYSIPNHPDYNEEYKNLTILAKSIGSFYIGFKPGSLTPLPNREGLNMSERSIQNVKTQLEIIIEALNEILIPSTKFLYNEAFKMLHESKIKPEFFISSWCYNVGKNNLDVIFNNLDVIFNSNLERFKIIQEKLKNQKPTNTSEALWSSISKLVIQHTKIMAIYIGDQKLSEIIYIAWAKNFPEKKHYRQLILNASKSKLDINNFYMNELKPTYASYIKMRDDLSKLLDTSIDLRLASHTNYYGLNSNWNILTNQKKINLHKLNHKKRTVYKTLLKEDKIKPQPKLMKDELFTTNQDQEQINNILLDKHIIIAKTIPALKKTKFDLQKYFSSSYSNIPKNSYSYFHINTHTNSAEKPILAIIVHDRKNAYQIAKDHLKKEGWIVIEADEPEVAIKSTKITTRSNTGKITESYALLDLTKDNWVGTEYTDTPDCYVYETLTQKKSYNSMSSAPIRAIKPFTKAMVMVTHKNQVKKLEENGVPDFKFIADKLVKKFTTDIEYLQKIYIIDQAKEYSILPSVLMDLPEVQKFFNIPFIHNRDKEKYYKQWEFLQTMTESRSIDIDYDTIKNLRQMFSEIERDDSVSLVLKKLKKTFIFNRYKMQNEIFGMKPGELKVYSEKVLRFLRTI